MTNAVPSKDTKGKADSAKPDAASDRAKAKEREEELDPEAPHVIAARSWAKTVFGAPMRLEELVRRYENTQIDVVRLATDYLARKIVTETAPFDGGAHPSAPVCEASSVDPWQTTPEELRTRSLHVVGCTKCGGPGCGACSNTGRQLAFLTFREERKTDVVLHPDMHVAGAYPRLAEPVFLDSHELDEDDVDEIAFLDVNEPIRADMLAPGEERHFRQAKAKLDFRTTKLLRQQYVHLSVARCALVYTTCGMEGEIIQWGKAFEYPSSAKDPVRQRLRTWTLASILWALALFGLWLLVTVRAAYFATTNIAVAAFFVVAFVSATLATGGALRGWRPSGKVKLRAIDLVAAGGVLLAIAGGVAVRKMGSPRVSAAKEAIAAGNIPQAEKVIAALAMTGATEGDLAPLRDDIEFAQAKALPADERFKKMLEIGEKTGTHAADAQAEIKEHRMDEVRALVAKKKPKAVHARIDELFPESQDPDILELRARAFDLEFDECDNDGCRYVAGQKAARAAATSGRKSRVAELRGRFMMMLDEDVDPVLTRVQRLRRLRALDERAKELAPLIPDDQELLERISKVTRRFAKEREQTLLLGADRDLLKEIYGDVGADEAKPRLALDDVIVYFALDSGGGTDGLYVTGATPEARKKGITAQYRVMSVVAKVCNKPVSFPPAPPATSTTPVVWKEGGIKLEARYDEGKLVELRVGEAMIPNPKERLPGRKNPPAKPPPQKVKILAYPGGDIAVDGVKAGRDAVELRLAPGEHELAVSNPYAGEHKETFTVADAELRVKAVW